MHNLSMKEFKEVCDILSPKKFIFSSENQNWNKVEHTIKLNLTFKVMMISLSPNTICLKSSNDYLCLNRVKYIKKNEEESILGTVFTIICGDSNSNSNDVAYTIIAR